MKIPFFLLLSFISFKLFAKTKEIKVYAASSLTNVLSEIAKTYTKSKIIFNFDASSKLATQIQSGAPSDIFFSADTDWMDFLDQNNKISKKTRIDLVSNKIVTIVNVNAKIIPKGAQDLTDPKYKHIALAGENVPAGKFARHALNYEKVLTDEMKKKIVNADNVRVALSWVAANEAEVGVVYATDVLIEPKVKVAFVFKDTSYPQIKYPAAVVESSNAKDEAQEFLDYCRSREARKLFVNAGFILL